MNNVLSMWMQGLTLCTGAAVLAAAVVRIGPEDQSQSDAPMGMVYVAGGDYQPLYSDPSGTAAEAVEPFYLDQYPVTNAEFLAFLRENPSWQRSKIRSLFADPGYLNSWSGDLDFGPDSLADRPVVNVSWFAARAYAEWRGLRLPTTAEWELAAGQTKAGPVEEYDAASRRQALAWYSRPASATPDRVGSTDCNESGICDLHGLVWEWVDDFNSALVTGESRNNGDLDLTLYCGSAAISASEFDDYAAFLRFGFRSGLEASYTVASLGFRCAIDATDVNARPGPAL